MNYIVLDMEWNQPWPGSPSSKKVLPVTIRGEIIQIGAVRLDQEGGPGDEFQIMVAPKYYRRLDRRYNAQMIFNAQTDGSNSQKALKTAMEVFEIQASRPAHDALGDAYHTALICQRLDLERGIGEYDQAVRSHENGFHGAELPGCLDRKVFRNYADRQQALAAMAGCENRCPVCGAQMLGSRWFAQPGHRYMDLATCAEHGKFLIRVRLSAQPDGTVRVSRLTYEATSEAAQAYARRVQKADPETPARPRRRRRRGKKPAEEKREG